MLHSLSAIGLCLLMAACNQHKPSAQALNASTIATARVGGPCEGCEAIYECPVAFEDLNEVDTLPIFNEEGPKLIVSGTVYKADGVTPAPDVVLYVYQTDRTGRYRSVPDSTVWAHRHGSLRGWMRTNAKGEYRFYTVRPGSYTKDGPPAHIHITVKEPDKNEYWLDDFQFDDDAALTQALRNRQQARGGDGILQPEIRDGIQYAERNIYLGRNVTHYPQPATCGLQSGLPPGEACPAFDPVHISGADAGTKACPMCKYGYGQGVMVWFKPAELPKMKAFAQALESEMQNRGEKALRVFLVCMVGEAKQLQAWAAAAGLQKVALVQVPSATDKETSGAFRINPAADNTVMVYKKRKVAANRVNTAYTQQTIADALSQL